MSAAPSVPLLVGEVFVDYTLTPPDQDNKLRLGGVVHAARGLWALDRQYDVAAILPSYLEEITRTYLAQFGCRNLFIIGLVNGAPNLTMILDVREIGNQGYDTPLRLEKSITLDCTPLHNREYKEAIFFPGSYDTSQVCAALPLETKLHLDIAYDLENPDLLKTMAQPIASVLISTSSPLFLSLEDQTIDGFRSRLEPVTPSYLILKHNRGGAEVRDRDSGTTISLPAQLGVTVNSVGVGDVFAAAFAALASDGAALAGRKATLVASSYSQTTQPDTFKLEVKRNLNLPSETIMDLGGVYLPWITRQSLPIYLAAPDFAQADRSAIDSVLSALNYHNFNVRRPVMENGELPAGSTLPILRTVFKQDWALIRECKLMFAVPTGRDPGTLVEVGVAIERGIPVVTYDPSGEAMNTMVIAGSSCYSDDLDVCLNAVFTLLAKIWNQ